MMIAFWPNTPPHLSQLDKAKIVVGLELAILLAFGCAYVYRVSQHIIGVALPDAQQYLRAASYSVPTAYPLCVL